MDRTDMREGQHNSAYMRNDSQYSSNSSGRNSLLKYKLNNYSRLSDDSVSRSA